MNLSLKVAPVLFLINLALSSAQYSRNADTSSAFPILEGTRCLESNLVYDYKVTRFEFNWRLKNFKQYYLISKKFQRQLELKKQILFPQGQNSYAANITFKFNTPTIYASDKELEYVRVEIKLIPGNTKLDEDKFKEFEYEGEIVVKSGVDSLTTGSVKGSKSSYSGSIEFSYYKKVSVAKIESVIGVEGQSGDKPVEVDFILNQYQLPQAVGIADLQANC